MERTDKNTGMNMAALAHISTFSKYIIPFGNFILPIIIWGLAKKDKFVEDHSRQALNFQISLFLYAVLIISAAISAILLMGLGTDQEFYLGPDNFYYGKDISEAIPTVTILAITGFLLLALFILELVSVITASMHAYNNQSYKYPLAITFIKSSSQSINEQNNNTKNESL